MISKREIGWRMLILGLFVICLLGPWMFEQLSVPAQYPCDKPTVRLSSDFCGYPLSGYEIFILIVSSSFYMLREITMGNSATYVTEYLILIYPWIIVLPLFNNLLLLRKKSSRRLQTINLLAWSLACLITLLLFVLHSIMGQFINSIYLLWGIWLYIFMAIGAIVFESLSLRSKTEMKSRMVA